MLRSSLLAATFFCFTLAGGASPSVAKTITIVSWGGSYEVAQREAFFEPFTRATGIRVKITRYNGGLDGLRERAGVEGWDVIDMVEDQAIAACETGLLRRLDHDKIAEPADGIPVAADFVTGAFRDCSIAQNLFATVVAYDERAFPGLKPTRIEDFFDLDRFPGKRAIEKSPDVILEWALMAEGVPPSQVYDLLSTDRGLRLAFRKLDQIRSEIIWWTDAATPAKMLRNGTVAMASGYNGRFFSVAADDDVPVAVVWNGRIIGYDVWAIPKSADEPEAAEQFLRFATAPDRMAELAERIPYGPARHSALQRIGLHPDIKIPMRAHLPNAPQHADRALIRDSNWYAHTRDLRMRRFQAWLEGEEK